MTLHRICRLSIITTVAASICVFLPTVGCERFAETPLSGDTAPISEAEWPQVFIDITREAAQKHVDVEGFRVYHVVEDEYFLDCEASPDLLALMTVRWELSRVKEDHGIVRRFRERLGAKCPPPTAKDTDYFACANWLAGEKGDLFGVMHDRTNKRVVVRYYYNF